MISLLGVVKIPLLLGWCIVYLTRRGSKNQILGKAIVGVLGTIIVLSLKSKLTPDISTMQMFLHKASEEPFWDRLILGAISAAFTYGAMFTGREIVSASKDNVITEAICVFFLTSISFAYLVFLQLLSDLGLGLASISKYAIGDVFGGILVGGLLFIAVYLIMKDLPGKCMLCGKRVPKNYKNTICICNDCKGQRKM